jgi:hypothetical protein
MTPTDRRRPPITVDPLVRPSTGRPAAPRATIAAYAPVGRPSQWVIERGQRAERLAPRAHDGYC